MVGRCTKPDESDKALRNSSAAFSNLLPPAWFLEWSAIKKNKARIGFRPYAKQR